MNLMI